MLDADRAFVVDTAMHLFYRHGYHAVNMDRVASESRLDRTRLDALFADRNALILATLERRDSCFRDTLRENVWRRGNTPVERLLATFDFLREWYEADGFHGCMFINASVQFPSANDPVNMAAARHKKALYDYLHELCEAACPDHCDSLSQQLVLLMEGAIVTAQVTGNSDAANHARAAAELLVKNAVAS